MKKILLGNASYQVIEDYKEGFDKEEIEKKYTEYFQGYDYIVGDWAYGKLRLKGFCKPTNKLFKKINDFSKLKQYLQENCAYDCRYFVLEKELDE